MKVKGIIWLRNVVDKLAWKHNVTTNEVEETFNRSPRYRFIETGDVEGEDLYAALGQTKAGRYLIIYFVHKTTGEALVISARDMDPEGEKSLWQEMKWNATQFRSTLGASRRQQRFGTATIWLTTGT